MGSGPYPIITCPDCFRPVKVSPGSERVSIHNVSALGGECPASGRRIDLYGTNEKRESRG